MSKIPIITLFAILISVAVLADAELPELPYYDWGACPFEGCIYQQWEAIQAVTAYEERDKNSKIAFKIKAGEFVDAVTGVVITYEYGKTKILKPLEAYFPNSNQPSLIIEPEEIVYSIHYVGEGWDLFWYKGKVYVGAIATEEVTPIPPPPEFGVQCLSMPKYVWWVQIKNNRGQIGWTDETEAFRDKDQFE